MASTRKRPYLLVETKNESASAAAVVDTSEHVVAIGPDGITELSEVNKKRIHSNNFLHPTGCQQKTTNYSPVVDQQKLLLTDSVQSSVLLESMKRAALKWFGIERLNAFQIESILSVFEKRDSLIVVPTGAGKSLCYQLPALMSEAKNKSVLVISPLIALMEDQVSSLKAKSISAISTSGGTRNVLQRIRNNEFRLIYSSPEYVDHHHSDLIGLPQFLLIAIDECHCISEWGHSFRPAYRKLPVIKSLFPRVPIMCLTATATKEVQRDISHLFQLKHFLHLTGGVNRPNVYYRVVQRSGNILYDFAEFLNISSKEKRQHVSIDNSSVNAYCSTLIYVATKKEADMLADTLNACGVAAASYHAGRSTKERSKVHQDFMSDVIQVVCATIAYGMGIDKQDIRRIIHWCLPTSVEAYSQQSGRAGRDRQNSEAVLMWAPQDPSKLQTIILRSNEFASVNEKHKERMIALLNCSLDYVNHKLCRRKFLMDYFGEKGDETTVLQRIDNERRGFCVQLRLHTGAIISYCGFCDMCAEIERKTIPNTLTLNESLPTPTKAQEDYTLDLTQEAQLILRCIVACKERTGMLLPCKVAIGSAEKDVVSKRLNRESCYGQGASRTITWWKELVACLKKDGYLEDKLMSGGGPSWKKGRGFQFFALKLTPKARRFLVGSDSYLVTNPSGVLRNTSRKSCEPVKDEQKGAVFVSAFQLQERNTNKLKQKLIDLRLKEARRQGLAPYMLLNMPLIMKIVQCRPSSVSFLKDNIKLPEGMSFAFLNQIVEEIKQFCQQEGIHMDQPLSEDVMESPIRVSQVLPENYAESCATNNDCFDFFSFTAESQAESGEEKNLLIPGCEGNLNLTEEARSDSSFVDPKNSSIRITGGSAQGLSVINQTVKTPTRMKFRLSMPTDLNILQSSIEPTSQPQKNGFLQKAPRLEDEVDENNWDSWMNLLDERGCALELHK